LLQVLPHVGCTADRDALGTNRDSRELIEAVAARDPLVAVRDALKLMGFDEVIISMLPARLSRWRSLGLPGGIRALGVPVSEVTHRSGIDQPRADAPAPGQPARQAISSSSASSTSATSAL